MRPGFLYIAIVAIAVVCAALASPSSAADADDGKRTKKASNDAKLEGAKAKTIAGWLELIEIPAAGKVFKAKLDTGANTSSIHATKIEELKRDGKTWVRFRLPAGEKDDEPVTLERRRVRVVRIKDHDDPASRRPVVKLEICLDGERHEAEFTLADRSNFLYPVLLGRRFLAGIAVVDPAEKYLTSSKCSSSETED